MKSEIATVDKEIDKYEEYKKQLQDVTEAYENAENVKYALAVTGLNSEAEILQCRTDVLNNFANNYVATQQAIANAAVQSANAQIQAINAVAQAQKNNGGTPSTTPIIKKPGVTKPSTVKGGGYNTNSMMKYETGTEDAKPGIHEISENGDEIILDNYGNAILAQGHQLHAFEGGETVINSKETIELLKNQGRLVPVESLFDRIDASKFIDNMPHLTPNIPTPNYDLGTVNNSGSSISIGDIHIHKPIGNVDSFADAIIREFPNKMNQRMNKR